MNVVSLYNMTKRINIKYTQMGNCCELCLKNSDISLADSGFKILSDSRIEQASKNRCTRILQTNLFNDNTTFYVTTQPISKFQCQYLIMFSDTLGRVLRNPFIRELSTNIKNGLQNRISRLHGRAELNQQKKYVNITHPFGQSMKIYNLMITWLELFGIQEGRNNDQRKKLSQCIDNAFQEICSSTSQVVSFGIFQLSYQFGYSVSQFRKIIISKIESLSQVKKSLKITYFAHNQQNLDAFIDAVLTVRSEHTMVKSQVSSIYF